MASIAKIGVTDGDTLGAVRTILKKLLADEEIEAVFTPLHFPAKGVVMPTLVTDPEMMDNADPLSPSFPLNSAKYVARLTRGDSSGTVAAVLRPCEMRAFVELVKLNQGSFQNCILVGLDCYGALDNATYRAMCAEDPEFSSPEGSMAFMRKMAEGGGEMPLAKACKACEYPTPANADITLGLMGTQNAVLLISGTPRGEALINRLGFSDAGESGSRDQAVAELSEKRAAFRDAMIAETREATESPAKLAEYLAGCVNCYNCRAACPVCYCRECVFLTDVFDHKPWQYLGWAKQSGSLRMPTDTLFFHLTRMAHMSTSCVGCGQCSNACPNDIGVMELFRSVAERTQEAFGYRAGLDPGEKPPLSVFEESEFEEVTQGHA